MFESNENAKLEVVAGSMVRLGSSEKERNGNHSEGYSSPPSRLRERNVAGRLRMPLSQSPFSGSAAGSSNGSPLQLDARGSPGMNSGSGVSSGEYTGLISASTESTSKLSSPLERMSPVAGASLVSPYARRMSPHQWLHQLGSPLALTSRRSPGAMQWRSISATGSGSGSVSGSGGVAGVGGMNGSGLSSPFESHRNQPDVLETPGFGLGRSAGGSPLRSGRHDRDDFGFGVRSGGLSPGGFGSLSPSRSHRSDATPSRSRGNDEGDWSARRGAGWSAARPSPSSSSTPSSLRDPNSEYFSPAGISANSPGSAGWGTPAGSIRSGSSPGSAAAQTPWGGAGQFARGEGDADVAFLDPEETDLMYSDANQESVSYTPSPRIPTRSNKKASLFDLEHLSLANRRLRALGVDDFMDVWVERMRQWVVAFCMRPLLSLVRAVDKASASYASNAGRGVGTGMGMGIGMGSPLGTGGGLGSGLTAGLDSGRSGFPTFNAAKPQFGSQATGVGMGTPQSAAASAPDVLSVYQMHVDMYLDIGGAASRDYVLQRIRVLSESSCLSLLLWNAGGQWNRKDWTSDLPSDARIVAHLFCTFLDIACSSGPVPKRAFSQSHLAVVPETPDKGKALLVLYEASVHPPHFEVVMRTRTSSDTIPVASGKQNVFVALVLFVYLLRQHFAGYIGHVSLSDPGIRLTAVVG